MNDAAKVAGLKIGFSGFHQETIRKGFWEDFLTDDTPPYDLTFCYHNEKMEFVLTPNDYLLSPLGFHRHADCTVVGFWHPGIAKYSDVKMVAGKYWSHFDIYAPADEPCDNEINLLTDAAFRSRITYYSGFAVHASAVIYNGEAVIFAARSGVGKSTHAELWREHLGADILNGDHALVRCLSDGVYAFGAPWSGTSPYKKNDGAPLKSIVILEQAKQNEIRRLTGAAAYLELASQCHLPTWDDALKLSAMCHIEQAISKIPVYKLGCNTDPAAAILVRNTVY